MASSPSPAIDPAPPPPPSAALPPPPPGGLPRRRRWLIPGAIVAAGLVALLALWGAGIGPFARPGNPTAGPRTFVQASGDVSSAESGAPGGTWTPILAVGLLDSSNLSTPTSAVTSLVDLANLSRLGCDFSPNGKAPAEVAAPGRVAATAAGAFDVWLFFLKNASNSALLAVDDDGSVSNLGTLAGGLCSIGVGLLPGLPSGAVDSPVAYATALAHGGSTFLGEVPAANVSFGLTPALAFGVNATPSQWVVRLSSCPLVPALTGGNVTGKTWTANISAASGAFEGSTNSTAGCAGGIGSLGGSVGGLTLGSVHGILRGSAPRPEG